MSAYHALRMDSSHDPTSVRPPQPGDLLMGNVACAWEPVASSVFLSGLSAQYVALEAALGALATSVTALTTRVTTCESLIAALTARVTALELLP